MLTAEVGTYSTAGLCRRHLSVTVRGITHHLVAYFDIQAIMSNELSRPSDDPSLAHIIPRPELLSQNSFTIPVGEDDQPTILRVLGG